MSHVTTAFGNFTVQSVDFVVPGGADIPGSVGQTVELTLIPDTGFELIASNFSPITPLPSTVSNVAFTQNGANVICTLTLASQLMPMQDLTVPICFNGTAIELGVGISGDIVYTINNTTITPNDQTYTNTGPTGTIENIITRTVEPIASATTKYFPTPPTLSIDEVRFPGNYNITSTETYTTIQNIERLTRVVFNVDYTYPDVNVSGDSLNLVANAIDVPILVLEITGYSLNQSPINAAGETRSISILGTQGSEFVLDINQPATNKPTFSNGTSQLTGIIGASGTFTDTITFPSIAGVVSSQTYEFELSAGSGTTLNVQQNNPFTVLQTENVTFTVNMTSGSNFFTLTTRNNSFSFPANTQMQIPDNLITVSYTAEAPAGESISFVNLIADTDWTFNNGGDSNTANPVLLTSSVIGASATDVTFTIIGTVSDIGSVDFSKSLDVNSFITTTSQPVCNSYELDMSSATADTTYSYTNCEDIATTVTLAVNDQNQIICAKALPTVTSGDGTVTEQGPCSVSAVGYNITSSNNSSALACASEEIISDAIYVPNNFIFNGQIIYADSSQSITFPGQNKFYRILNQIGTNTAGLLTNMWIKVDTNGVVLQNGNCTSGSSISSNSGSGGNSSGNGNNLNNQGYIAEN
jgi:hypothetical protein